MNKLKSPPPKRIKPPGSVLSVKTRKTFLRVFRAINLFGYLEIRSALKTLPFILFLSGLALLFIANGYYTEKTIREIDKTGKEIKELKSEYTTTKSELMIKSGQSQVAQAVAGLGLEESRVAPAKIEVDRTEKDRGK